MDNSTKYYIFINGFWSGFVSKNDGIHIGFIETILKKTKLLNFELTDNIDKANILLESCFGSSISNTKKWDKKIYFSGESWKVNEDNYDIILKSSYSIQNIIDLPLCVYYIHNNNFLNKLISRPEIINIPPKFCCFCVSNGNSFPRNNMFSIINSYKKVDSIGKFNNNVGFNIDYPYWSTEYIDFIKQYKFIICFENSFADTYVTEKIVNAQLANIIPIYWGTPHVKNIFNENSMIYLSNENLESEYINVLNKVIELDQDDSKYLEFVNRDILQQKYFESNYSIDVIGEKLDKLL